MIAPAEPEPDDERTSRTSTAPGWRRARESMAAREIEEARRARRERIILYTALSVLLAVAFGVVAFALNVVRSHL